MEVRPGIEIEIDFAPHPNFAGQLTMLAAPARRMARLQDEGKIDVFTVSFGAANVLHVLVERRIRKVAKRKARPKAPRKTAKDK